MAVPHITSFCWCMGLEAGTKLIGFLHLALSFGLMVFSSVYAARFGELVGTAEDAGDRLYRTWYIISVAVARHSRLLRGYVWAMLALYVASVLYVLVSMAFGFSVTGSDIFIAFVEGPVR
ncbi:unnamed protein product [Leptidea sinapis]|uniref:Uncharacterized protein n=1 Tax=Leptidea sinapis TaxID=189913 RepID=A0A5E4Q0C8_9NEOP|nr:unnamed protein product [Leptidea sinapis]